MNNRTKVLKLIQKQGILRARELASHGIPRATLSRLARDGEIRRIGRGMYELPDAEPAEHVSLIEACKRVPGGTICLISALTFHGLTTQIPYEVWMAIDYKAHKPVVSQLRMRFVRFSGRALSFGVETHGISGAQIRVTSAAKAVADCFKYRHKIGVDVGIEALKEYLRQRSGSLDELWAAAEVCRVQRVIRPYVEAIQ